MRPLALPLVAALALGLAACGEAPPQRWAVARRDLDWQPAGPAAAREPLSLAFPFDGDAGGWRAAGGPPELRDGALVVRGRGQADLLGPAPGAIDPELHQHLALRLRARGATALSVHWRAAGADFAPGRATADMALPAGDGWQALSIPLATLRGVRGEADAEAGVEELRLRFRGAAGADLEVELDQLALVSDFDDPSGHGLARGTLQRAGVLRQGLALRGGAAARVELPGGGPRRLRFALAAAGARAPLRVTLGSESGRVPDTVFELRPGAPWTEHKLALPGGEPLHLTLRCASDEPRAVALVGTLLLLEPADEPRDNLLLYVEDTLRADRLSTFGGAWPTDPWLASFAAQGAVLPRTWSTSNWTRPAISSLLTGLSPAEHGNGSHLRRVPDALVTLAEALAAQGWLTASFVTNYHAGAWSGLAQGFDAHAEPRAFDAAALQSTLTSALLAEPLAGFLREHADEQVFVFAHSLDPHAPYEPPADLLLRALREGPPRTPPPGLADAARWERSVLAYDAEVLHNDGQLARLDATLAELGLAPRTLFCFVADHGEQFGEHGRWEHRQGVFDGELRVPWALRLPGRVAAGVRIDEPASLRDVAPTLLSLLGVAAPPGWSGRDFAPLLAPPGAVPPARPRAEPLVIDAFYDEPPGAVPHELAVVLWPWKLHVAADRARDPASLRATALYDLSRDPGEREDLLGRADTQAAAGALLEAARAEVAAGAAATGAAADAAPMDPALMEWMRAMGYLR